MNIYKSTLVFISRGRNAFSREEGFAVVVDCPIPERWHQGNVEPGGGYERFFITESGAASSDESKAFLSQNQELAVSWAKKIADDNMDKDANVYLLSHPSTVFKI